MKTRLLLVAAIVSLTACAKDPAAPMRTDYTPAVPMVTPTEYSPAIPRTQTDYSPIIAGKKKVVAKSMTDYTPALP